MDKAIDDVLDMFDTNKDGMIDRSELTLFHSKIFSIKMKFFDLH